MRRLAAWGVFMFSLARALCAINTQIPFHQTGAEAGEIFEGVVTMPSLPELLLGRVQETEMN